MGPIWQVLNGIANVIWRSNLERNFLAVDDRGRRELLEA